MSSADDLVLVDDVLRADLPQPGQKLADGTANAFFATTPLLAAEALDEAQLQSLFAGDWRHVEYSASRELLSFFCGDDTHVALPAKERIVERQHGTILRSGTGAALARQYPERDVLRLRRLRHPARGGEHRVWALQFGAAQLAQYRAIQRYAPVRQYRWTVAAARRSPRYLPWRATGCAGSTRRSDCAFEIVASVTTDTLEYRAAPAARCSARTAPDLGSVRRTQ